MAIFNPNNAVAPSTSPRDLTPVPIEGKPTVVALNWQPPRQTNGQVTGYFLFLRASI